MTEEPSTVREDVLNSLLGRILNEHLSEEGLCFTLDDGRKIFVVALAVSVEEEKCLH